MNAADFAFEPTVRHWSEVLCTRSGRTASADGCRNRNPQAPPGGHSVLMTAYTRQLQQPSNLRSNTVLTPSKAAYPYPHITATNAVQAEEKRLRAAFCSSDGKAISCLSSCPCRQQVPGFPLCRGSRRSCSLPLRCGGASRRHRRSTPEARNSPLL